MKKNNGMSTVISIVIMIALVIVIAGIIWGIVENLVEGNLGDTEACAGNYGKVTLNERYTCYNETSDSVRFSLNLEDVEVTKILISISSQGTTNSYVLNYTEGEISGVINYPDGSTNIVLPGQNSGKTYSATGFTTKPDSIQILPYVKGVSCGVSDSISNIESCFLLA